ncbi:similar to Saccharomyces cerevisiae YGR008C STF2 Protein involved in regulation of the mitochondrial F1F0-ATP synthase [Maudiozyma barnettii]|uniref:Similar to Saccharomyces cerevisiae YGR008C STF2 Protein involved in regulation of the mitochondrial F1F0-ATP synthase n=1 Tax=Maudiozyma barnettii TaxID=61262 RepID=A0A8H2ZJ82_9SACH|nr:ATPase-stabilizing factor family protein [Kazachstania barnettii]CAB4256718.1 similar to Saccharomyces cerevisiae YGR008C STF2 Protein involved in regulation of the mitochondrial F1F0-ATP synthase [Kazachstania barnettii]CAD1785374.1 similar to Saccharomyces cerevisiae YGR008C STF2 Protein involved in regulation of the mitochondrial F1F0-ATP synthase [Kazachstania barnettii]
MTRTNKWTVHESRADARYFTHNGNFGESPQHIKKGGSGRGGWGKAGDEINDLVDSGEIQPVYNKKRRPSNVNNQMNAKRFEDIQNYQI